MSDRMHCVPCDAEWNLFRGGMKCWVCGEPGDEGALTWVRSVSGSQWEHNTHYRDTLEEQEFPA